jgi:hypothetical protein
MIPSVLPPIWNTIAALSRSIWRIRCDHEEFREIAKFSPRLLPPQLTIFCQKIRHSANIAQ